MVLVNREVGGQYSWNRLLLLGHGWSGIKFDFIIG